MRIIRAVVGAACALALSVTTSVSAQEHGGTSEPAPSKPARGAAKAAAHEAEPDREKSGATRAVKPGEKKPAAAQHDSMPATKAGRTTLVDKIAAKRAANAAANAGVTLAGKRPSAAQEAPASETADAETVRGYVDGSEVAPKKPQIAKRPPARPAEHAHAEATEKPQGAHEARSAVKNAKVAVTHAPAKNADTEKDKTPVTATAAAVSAAQAAATVAAALRAATLIRRPAPPAATARVAAPKAAGPARPAYAITWPSRSISIRWPESPDRVQLEWPDQRPPDVHLRWETPVTPRP